MAHAALFPLGSDGSEYALLILNGVGGEGVG